MPSNIIMVELIARDSTNDELDEIIRRLERLKQGRDDTEESAETEPQEDVDDDGYFCKLASCKDYKKHWTVQNHCQEEGCGRPGTNILTHPDHPDATVKKETFCEEKKCEKYVRHPSSTRHCAECGKPGTSKLSHPDKPPKAKIQACEHEGCQKLIFPWDDGHETSCYYKPIPCPFCVEKISKSTIKEHLKECVPWIDESNPKEGSYCVTDASELLKRGLNIELESIKKSFVVLRNNQIIVFKRNEVEYEVSLINLSNEFVPLDLTYWLEQESRAFDKYSTISLRKDTSEEEFKATIPLTALDLLLDKRGSEEGRIEGNGTERFFDQLLDRRREDYESD
jgi:hypothetical protein